MEGGEYLEDDGKSTWVNSMVGNTFSFKIESKKTSEELINIIKQKEGINHVMLYQPLYKLSPDLYQMYVENEFSKSETNTETINLTVMVFIENEGDDYPELREKIEALGAIINSGYPIDISIPKNKVIELSKIQDIEYILRAGNNSGVPVMNKAVEIYCVDTIGWDQLGLTGAGEIISIADTGLDNAIECDSLEDCNSKNTDIHADFKGRIVAVYGSNPADRSVSHAGHGTHVAGIAVWGI